MDKGTLKQNFSEDFVKVKSATGIKTSKVIVE